MWIDLYGKCADKDCIVNGGTADYAVQGPSAPATDPFALRKRKKNKAKQSKAKHATQFPWI